MTFVRGLLLATFCAASLVLLRFAFGGGFVLGSIPVHSPINAETVAAVAFLLLALLNSTSASSAVGRGPSLWAAALAIVACLGAAFARVLNFPLLYDAYTDLYIASTDTRNDVLCYFYCHPDHGDYWFRPFGLLTYWLDFRWAGFNPMLWHLWNVVVHLLVCVLVYVFVRQLSANSRIALTASLLFGLNGSRPEVVAWVGERYDLLAALFVLAALIAFNQYLAEGTGSAFRLMLVWCALALLSKESAYCLPILALLLTLFRPAADRTRMLRALVSLFAVTTLSFLYRTWVLSGVGGYVASNGQSTILRFNILHTLKALLLREWAVLAFPINWSVNGNPWLSVALVLLLISLGCLLIFGHARRRDLWVSLLIALAAALPVQHLLLISENLNGSRVLYLPALGASMFLAFLIHSCRWQMIAASGVLLAQLIFLEHNLSIWRSTAIFSRDTCHSLGEQLAAKHENAFVIGLPSMWNGVYFLQNGFRTCVAMNSPASMYQVHMISDPKLIPPGKPTYVWNPATKRLDRR